LSGHEKTAVFSGTKGIEGESDLSVENVGIDIDNFLQQSILLLLRMFIHSTGNQRPAMH
jgi:hypothetical protein